MVWCSAWSGGTSIIAQSAGGNSRKAQPEPLLLPAPQPEPKQDKKRGKAESAAFSKAFDNFVGDEPGDVEGLLAYALYKRTIRDHCRNGVSTILAIERDPPKSEVETYRDSARQMLEEVMQIYEQEAAPDWQQSYFETRLGEWKGEIKALIRNRTSMGGQIAVNLAAWVITIVLSLAIYYALTVQDVDDVIRQKVDQAVADAQGRGDKENSAFGQQPAP